MVHHSRSFIRLKLKEELTLRECYVLLRKHQYISNNVFLFNVMKAALSSSVTFMVTSVPHGGDLDT